MVEKQEGKNKVTMQKQHLIMIGVVLFIFFGILGFLILTKDTRQDGAVTTDESQLEKRVDVVDLDEQENEEDVMDMDETEDTVETPIQQALPDLHIKEYTLPEGPQQNEEITVELVIENKGDADAGSFRWEWWATEDEMACDDDIAWLDPGDSQTVECDYAYDDAGTFDTKAVVDSDSEVEESDETNNELIEEIEVAEEQLADLVVSEYSFDPVPEQDVEFEVRIGIRNEGNVAAEDFYWEWWPTWADYACRESVSTIAPNSEKVVTCNYTYGGWSTYDTKAVVDADDDVEELDEDNNEYSEEVVPIH